MNAPLASIAVTVLAALLAACGGGNPVPVAALARPAAPQPPPRPDVLPAPVAPASTAAPHRRGEAGISTLFELEIGARFAAPLPCAGSRPDEDGPRGAIADDRLAAGTR